MPKRYAWTFATLSAGQREMNPTGVFAANPNIYRCRWLHIAPTWIGGIAVCNGDCSLIRNINIECVRWPTF